MSGNDTEDFFGGARRTASYSEQPVAPTPDETEAEPDESHRAGPSIAPPVKRGTAAAALRAAFHVRPPKPEPPKRRIFGNARAMAAYEEELKAWQADERAFLLQNRPRGVAQRVLVTNTKGGVGKTPTVLCLSAALGELLPGSTVAAWEAAEERGTLLNRVSGDKGEGLMALLRDARTLIENPSAVVLDRYAARLATGARVFGSPEERDVFSGADIETIDAILSRTYELTVIDSANMARSQAFRKAVELADAVVVPTVISVDSATRMLETIELFEKGDPVGKVPHRPELLKKLIVVITDDGRDTYPGALQVMRDTLDVASIPFVEVPYDKHIAEGMVIEWSKLSDVSHDAWCNVGASVLERI